MENFDAIKKKGKCEDCYVGKLSDLKILKCKRVNFKKSTINEQKCASCKKMKVVIILESPGRDEFEDSLRSPALGKTGERINSYLKNMLEKKAITDAHIFLVNAVQYQCNGGNNADKKNKKKMFSNFWCTGDLSKRLEKIKPCVIINASGYFCKERVNKEIKKCSNNIICYSVYHPIRWNSRTELK